MHCSKALLPIALFCATTLAAQNVYDIKTSYYGDKPDKDEVKSQATANDKKSDNGILTGFTGGMKLHVGYAFAQSPDELFHNGSLQDLSGLPQDGVIVGLGGELRLHLINHIHLGADGGMSAMPLKGKSSIRTGWGGALCDFYGTIGKVQLCIGGVIGGGTTKRMYVPDDGTQVMDENATIYNASYTETPFFLLDPYVGLEVSLSQRIGLQIKVDYMLPFGQGDSGITTETIRWSNFLSPSGPRLYVGMMFGRHDRKR